MSIWLITASFFLLNQQTQATHIVGGVVNYEYIGNDRYEITLRVFRDCFFGQAPFDDPAALGIYDDNGFFVDNISMFSPVITQVNPPITNPCLQIPPNICVEEGLYTTVFTAPSPVTGYHLVYQRCCRNNTINNVELPSGSTYTAFIPPTNPNNNSNPEFNLFPPLFICVNSPLVFNHSAADQDGDSLVYRICTPIDGADTINPAPNPPLGPPFDEVVFIPPFNATNPLGGVALSIDPNSGVLTGTPNSTGQYVVGVCVDEFRNGVLLSTTLRDFQFNVAPCNIPVANIPSTDIDPNTGIGFFDINCQDFSIEFINTSSGAVSYWWNFGDLTTTNDTSTQFEPTYFYPDTGQYLVTLIATNAQSCTDTTFAYIKIFPIFIPDFNFIEACQGQSVLFDDLSTTTIGIVNAWIWTFGDGTGSFDQNPSHAYNNPGVYTINLSVSTDHGCNENVQQQITIFPSPTPDFTNDLPCANNPIQFANLSQGNIVSYNWDFDDGQGSTDVHPSHIFVGAGIFQVALTATSDLGCDATTVIPVTINPLPVVNLSPPATICPGTDIQLTASGGSRYDWSPGLSLSDSTISNPVATPLVPTEYKVVVTDNLGCVDSNTVVIDLFPAAIIDAGEDTSVCFAPSNFIDSVRLVATGGIQYVWVPGIGLSDPNIANPLAKPSMNTLYLVIGTDGNGCRNVDSVNVFVLDPQLDLIVNTETEICEDDTIAIIVVDQGASFYRWNPSTGVSNPDIRDPEFYPIDTTLYILEVRNYCYNKFDSILVLVNPLPSVNTGSLDSICIGESYQFNVTGGDTYVWDNEPSLSATNIPNPVATPTSHTTYFVTVTDSNGCENRDSALILVYLLPNALAISTDPKPFVCFGLGVQLQASGGVDYHWRPAPGLTDTLISNPIVIPPDTTTYTVDVTNVHGCVLDASVIINIQGPVVAVGPDFFSICEGHHAPLTVSGGFYYEWRPPDFLTQATLPNPVAGPPSTTVYTAYVSNDCFTDSLDVTVEVRPLPDLVLSPDDTIFRFENTVISATGASNYIWYPSSGLEDPLSPETNASPFNSTTYIMTATASNGCINIDSLRITVIPFTDFQVPTGFSPNGDGVNDLFGVLRHLNIEILHEFNVYNRWGQKVYATKDLEGRWDGRFDGNDQPLGVFAWQARYKTYDGDVRTTNGNVTLIR